MIRFIQLSALCRLVGSVHGYSRAHVQDMVRQAIDYDMALKARRSAGRIGLS